MKLEQKPYLGVVTIDWDMAIDSDNENRLGQWIGTIDWNINKRMGQ